MIRLTQERNRFLLAVHGWSGTLLGLLLYAVILTGMGQDGLRGCRAVVGAGGSVIAQDQATSVVWGMPGAVSNAGLCSAILPLGDIGPRLKKLTLPRT